MELSFLAVADDSLNENIKYARENNLKNMEIAYVYLPSKGGVNYDVSAISDMLKGQNVNISSVGVYNFSTICTDETEQKEKNKYVTDLFDAGKSLGAKVAIISCGNVQELSLDENISLFAKRHSFFKEEAEKRGLKLCIYFGSNECYIKDLIAVRKTVAAIPDLYIKFDPMSMKTKLNVDIYNFIEEFGASIKHVHAHDYIVLEDNRNFIEPPVGMGDVNWGKILGMFACVGYNGYLTIEPHGNIYGGGAKRFEYIELSRLTLDKYF